MDHDKMRNITDDLKERMAANLKRRADLKANFDLRMKALEEEAAALSRVIAAEERRFSEYRGGIGGIDVPAPVMPLADFIIERLAKEGPKTKEELRQQAQQERYFPDNDSGRRTIHTTVLNLSRGGRLRERDDGRYEVPMTLVLSSAPSLEPARIVSTNEGVEVVRSDPE